jgi:hypothetical protein
MALKRINISPIALSNSIANLLNCGVTSLSGPVGMSMAQPFLLINHMHFVNNDASAPHNFTLYTCLTGGSSATTALFIAYPLLALGVYDYYPDLRLDAADFLTGLADASNKIILTIDAEIGISG